MSRLSWARLQAYRVIHRVNTEQSFARPLIDTMIRNAELPRSGAASRFGAASQSVDISQSERDYAVLLALGVTAASGELDLIIDRSLTKRHLDAPLRTILQIATYELVFLHKPAYAIVDQAVQLTRRILKRATGFTNWAMHRITETAAGFPWGNTETDLVALAHSCAFPLWLAEQITSELGVQNAATFMHTANAPAPTFVQDLTSGETYQTVIHEDTNLQALLDSGQVIIADAATQEVAGLVADVVARQVERRKAEAPKPPPQEAAPQQLQNPGEASLCTLLEVGSGRGTKTVLINRSLQRSQSLPYRHIAIDNLAFKTAQTLERINTYQLTNVEALTADCLQLNTLIDNDHLLPECFDVIFIDAPCSGSGTLRRHPETRWRLTPQSIHELAEQGLAFLKALAPHVADGGTLVYSTCSIFESENEAVIREFLFCAEGLGFIPTNITRINPENGDCHFAAVLQRGSLK